MVIGWISAHSTITLVLLALAIVAAAVRLLTFDQFLPYGGFGDEWNMYNLTRDWRGVEIVPVVPQWLAGYPPLYIWLYEFWQQALEAFSTKLWILPGDYMYVARVMSMLAGILTTLLIGAAAAQLGGALAGWLAGLVWALSPIVVDANNLAIPDPFVYLTCAAAVVMAVRAYKRRSGAWTLGSLLAAILAIYLKYPAFYALVPWALVTIYLTVKQPRKMTPWLLLSAVIAAVFAYLLIFSYGAFRLTNREAETVRSSGLRLMVDSDRNLNNWYFALLPLGGPGIFIGTLVAAAAAYVVSLRQRWRTLDLRLIVILLVYAVFGVMVSAMFSNVALPAGKIRHVLPLTVALLVVWGAAIAQVFWTLGSLLRARRSSLGRALPLLAGVVGVLVAAPLLPGTVDLIQEYGRVETRYLLWQWSDINLPVDGKILMHDESALHAVWNRNWSGYDGKKAFDWWFADKPWETLPADYIDADITYFAFADSDRDTIYDGHDAELDAFLDMLVYVKTIEAGPDSTGPTAHIYRMMPPQVETQVAFGDNIALVGYDLTLENATPGGEIIIRPYWRAQMQPAANYSLFVHLYPETEVALVAQLDGAPTSPARPTLTWDDPDELYIGSDVVLPIPADTTPGRYRLALGLYNFETGERLTTTNGETYFAIPVEVMPVSG